MGKFTKAFAKAGVPSSLKLKGGSSLVLQDVKTGESESFTSLSSKFRVTCATDISDLVRVGTGVCSLTQDIQGIADQLNTLPLAHKRASALVDAMESAIVVVVDKDGNAIRLTQQLECEREPEAKAKVKKQQESVG